jgi:hypothetical protein
MRETLEELVATRKGYKYLNANGVSPFQHYTYDLESRRQMKTHLNPNSECACGEGWNLATLKWIAKECLKLDGIIVECEIPKKAQIVVPLKSDGKFRTDIIKIKKIHSVESLFPSLKDIKKQLSEYTPINPITAEVMPPKDKIRELIAQVRTQVWDQVRTQVGTQVWDQVWDQVWAQVRTQVGTQVWDQVWDQVRDQVWDQVRDQVGTQVWDQVWTQVGDQVWDQVRDQVWDQVRDQVGDQVRVCAYYAVKLFMNLPYEHPAFDLTRLGIIVVNTFGKIKVFGKGGKFLGEFEDDEPKEVKE